MQVPPLFPRIIVTLLLKLGVFLVPPFQAADEAAEGERAKRLITEHPRIQRVPTCIGMVLPGPCVLQTVPSRALLILELVDVLHWVGVHLVEFSLCTFRSGWHTHVPVVCLAWREEDDTWCERRGEP